jgi:hydroxymethylpyrimidine/phosphomethylpyrimidine kinase
MGAKNVLLKGGHLEHEATDILYDGREFSYFSSARIAAQNTDGTGCTLSSAITANLALGYTLNQAVLRAKEYITIAIQHSLSIGTGVGPIHHFYTLYKKAGLSE